MPARLNDGRRDSARKYRVNIASKEGGNTHMQLMQIYIDSHTIHRNDAVPGNPVRCNKRSGDEE